MNIFSSFGKIRPTRLKMLFRSKTAIKITFPRQFVNSKLSKANLQSKRQRIISFNIFFSQCWAAIQQLFRSLSIASQNWVKQKQVYATKSKVLSMTSSKPRPHLRNVSTTLSLVGPRLRSKSRSKMFSS